MFVFGGTNNSCANAPLGELDGTDLYCVLPAIRHFFELLRKTLPHAAIYCLINTQLKPEIADALKTVSGQNGITAVAFDHLDKDCGMQEIKTAVLSAMQSNN